jgi:hypothetical protein
MQPRFRELVVLATMWLAGCSSGSGSNKPSHDGGEPGLDVSVEASGSCEACSASVETPAMEAGAFLAEAGPALDVSVDTGAGLDQGGRDVPADASEDWRAADAPVDEDAEARATDSSDSASDAAEDVGADLAGDLPWKDVAQDAPADAPGDARVTPRDAIVERAGSAEAGLPADGCSGLAHGLTLSKLALYQAVEIPLMQDGVVAATASRTASVVLGRAALVRAFVKLSTDWVAREIAVRLHLASGGRETVLYAKKTVSVDSQPGSLESTVQIDVGGDLIAADTRYWVEAVECAPGQAGVLARPRFPDSGDAALDARPTGKLRIAFVPIEFGDLLPDTSDVAIAIYRNYIAAMYPTTEVVTSVVKGFSYTPTEGLWTEGYADYITDLLDWTTARRSYDNPADDVYYYGLFRPAASFDEACGDTDCVDGMGYVNTDKSRFGAGYRVAVSFSFADEYSARTIAHELGHNHGRNHAPCDDPNNPDLSYPYAGGSIGVWGYDRRDRSLKDPAKVTDIMGYCKAIWISDYTYQAFLERIAYLNGVTAADVRGTAEPARRWRALWMQGTEVRWAQTPPVSAPPAGATATARILDAAGNQLDTVTVYMQQVSLPNTLMVLVPEPQTGWHAIELPGKPPLAFGTPS